MEFTLGGGEILRSDKSGLRMTKSKRLRVARSEGLAKTKDYGILVFLVVGRHKMRAEAGLGSYSVSLRSPGAHLVPGIAVTLMSLSLTIKRGSNLT